ncbi:MAG: purine-nucleoside phosphorylase [Bacteroidetes bacterium]|nr:MAG: purine-nucleoside phosphorylase [Bacteroidota bacterium]
MLYDQIQAAVQFIRAQTDFRPEAGIILGTGLGNLTDDIEVSMVIPYADIPHFPISTVQSHKGQLIFGHLGGKPIVAMAGRFHYYEGYSMKQVTFPVRVLKFLGIKILIVSNVSGSTNADINAGDIVFIRDHINLQPENPLRGENDERLGVRFPDMSETYDAVLRKKALEIAQKAGIPVHEGVYVALAGPNLETPAEYQFLHTIGGDLVGMSTVPEIIVARHAGLRVFALSVVSNKCYPISVIQKTTVESVIQLARQAEPRMRCIVTGLLSEL